MSFEDLEPLNQTGAPLNQVVKEDLEPYSIKDLEQRILSLEAEIFRTRSAIETKGSKRSAADALFNL